MPRLKNRLHERFSWLVAEGMDRKAAYAKLCPHVTDPGQIGYQVYKRPEVKERIAEIQLEVASRAEMGLDSKRDLLRRMIDGEVPTKVIKRSDGRVEAIFDRLSALETDCKLAGDFDDRPERDERIKLVFDVVARNHAAPPRRWLNPTVVEVESGPSTEPETLEEYTQAPTNLPQLEDISRGLTDDLSK